MFLDFPHDREYRVVVNHEEQYSLWPVGRQNRMGWKDARKTGTKKACLAYFKEVWKDMRLLSVHGRMAEELHRFR